jgi:plastocyanin
MPSYPGSRLAIAAAAALTAACGGGGGGSSTPTGPSTPAPSTVTITITSDNGALSFSPNPASAGGQLVVFRNADSVVHRVVLNDGSIDTGDIAPGSTSRSVMMPAAGTNYHCSLHPGMIGAVSPSTGGAPPECTGPYCDPY